MATASGKGRKYSAEEIAGFAYQAGFRGKALATAVAVALAESGGVVNAHNPDGEDSRGLWQINVNPSTSWGRARAEKYGDLFDPVANARAAFEISGGGKSFNAWTTYAGTTAAGRGSSHSRHLAAARQAAAKIEGDPSLANVAVSDDGEASLTPQSTPAQIEQFIRANYPDVAGFLDNPELRAIMVDAAMKDEDDTEVLARLQRSKYWQENSPQSRAFDELRGRDRNAADQAVENARNVIGDAYSRLGVQASEADVAKIAENSIRAGWINLAGQVVNQAKLNDFAAWSLRRTGKTLTGETGMSAEALGQIARAYGVPVSRQFLEDKALRILEGGYTEDLFRQEMVQKAKGQWNDPDIQNALDQGRTVADFFDSHVQTLAELWEMDPGQLDIFKDPRLMEVTQFFDGEKRRAMTLGETAMFARKDDRYKKTRGAQKQAADFTMLVKREFEGVN